MIRGLTWAMLLACLIGSPVVSSAVEPATHDIRILDMRFEPATLQVKVGDVVTWTNKDIVPHTVTGAKKQLESGNIAPQKTWTLRVSRKGEVDYFCRYHPTMKGQLSVR